MCHSLCVGFLAASGVGVYQSALESIVDETPFSVVLEHSLRKKVAKTHSQKNTLSFLNGTNENWDTGALWEEVESDFFQLHQSIWPKLDYLVKTSLSHHPPSLYTRVSGGIFHDRLQTHVLIGLIRALFKLDGRATTSPIRVCETGFGAGHSIAMWGTAAKSAFEGNHSLEVLSFDFFIRVYQQDSINFLREELYNTSGNTLITIRGNTCNTVPKLFGVSDPAKAKSRCELLNGSSVCPSDNIDLVLLAASCGTIITSTAMDSLNNSTVYFLNRGKENLKIFNPETQGQWRWLLRNGCIADVRCFKDKPFKLQQDYVYAEAGTLHSQKFCVGLVTAGCNRPSFLNTETKQILGQMRRVKRNVHSREVCMKSLIYSKRSSILSIIAEHYKDFLVPLAELHGA
jgi:hypothetical protein